MTAIVWSNLLQPRNVSVDMAFRSLAGPTAVSGFSQVVASDAGIWRATFDGIPVYDQNGRSLIKLWRAIAGLAEGRLNALVIPICEAGRRPVPDGAADSEIDGSVPHSDDSYFSDGTGYVSRYTTVVTSAAAAVRGTTLSLIKTVAPDLEPGHRFSIGERLYQIKSVTAQDETMATVKIWPPLREFVEAGAQLEFDRPVLRVRLATDSEMDLPLEYGRWSFPSVNFIEDL